MSEYTLYVDESGEAGIEKVRSEGSGGASPYLCLGAALVPNDAKKQVREKINEIQSSFNTSLLHCKKLSHSKKVYYAREIAKEPIILFGVISLKETLGWYKEQINGDAAQFYNKCCQYLLELVGGYSKDNKLEPANIDLIFERGPFQYEQLRNFINICRNNPRHKNTRRLEGIDPYKIRDIPKDDEPLLQLADLTAHALYQCVEKTHGNYDIPEPRYFAELKGRFYHGAENNKIIQHGLMPLHNLRQIRIDEDVKRIIMGEAD